MKNIFKLEPGLPATSILKTAYYFLLGLSVLCGLILIMEGLNDPFGEFLIFFGVLVLLIIPLGLRVLFGLLLKNQ